MNKIKKSEKIPLHKSILGYKIMGLTIAAFLIALAVYYGLTNLGKYISVNYNADEYTVLILSMSIIFAFICFFWIFLAFMRSTVSDIKRLSSDLKRITDGELDLKISLSRKDELGDLARDISIMQNSLIERMEAERKAIKSNRALITSLSHDLRTPLTKQMCAIELALNSKASENEEIKKSLRRIYKHSEQIKSISDELFSYFLAEDNSEQHKINIENFDGSTLFGQLLTEYSDLLESKGYSVTLSMEQTENFTVSADVSYLTRIMDNLFSNIRKYADQNSPVIISLENRDKEVCISIQNAVRADDGKLIDSNNIGIYSAKRLAEALGGTLITSLEKNLYRAELRLKTE